MGLGIFSDLMTPDFDGYSDTHWSSLKGKKFHVLGIGHSVVCDVIRQVILPKAVEWKETTDIFLNIFLGETV